MNRLSNGARGRRATLLVTLLAALTLLSALGTNGSALSTQHAALVAAAPLGQPVVFGDGLLPAPGSSVPAGAVVIGCTVNSALPIADAELSIDGVIVATNLSPTGPPWFVRATVTVNPGLHEVGVTLTDTAGQAGGWTWQFTATGAPPPPPTATPLPATPTPIPGTAPIIRALAPAPGWIVPAGTQRIAAQFGTDSGWKNRTITLDGTVLTLKSEGVATGNEILSASAPVTAGLHTVAAGAIDVGGRQGSTQWTFLASGPDNAGALRITPLAPAPGLTLQNGASVRIAARVATSATLGTTTLMVDGKAVPTQGGGDVHQETIFFEATGVSNGAHTVSVQGSDNAGHTANVGWNFYVGAPANPADRTYYPQTGFSVEGPFKQYWEGLGADALQVLGYPISGLRVERLADGHDYTVQYFERVRLEWHPENQGSEFEVLYGLLGTAFHKPDPPVAKPAARPGEQYFPQTGHLVRGAFLQKWLSTGGVRVHGYPISEEIQEVSPTDGHVYLVQYFQRARFELHPENTGTPFEILLGMLGRQLYTQQYGQP